MLSQEARQKKILSMSKQIEELTPKVESLENAERHQLQNLQHSINEHNYLLNKSRTGELDSLSV